MEEMKVKEEDVEKLYIEGYEKKRDREIEERRNRESEGEKEWLRVRKYSDR